MAIPIFILVTKLVAEISQNSCSGLSTLLCF